MKIREWLKLLLHLSLSQNSELFEFISDVLCSSMNDIYIYLCFGFSLEL